MKTLRFHETPDAFPPEGEQILFVNEEEFYGTFEFIFGEVESQWVEYDQEGDPTGTQYTYEPGEPQPPGTRLQRLIVSGTYQKIIPEKGFLWCTTRQADQDLYDGKHYAED